MTKSVNESTVSSYSEHGSEAYEDPMNKNFLYGDIIVQFIRQIEFSDTDRTILDTGSMTLRPLYLVLLKGCGFFLLDLFGVTGRIRHDQASSIDPSPMVSLIIYAGRPRTSL